jgi:uncharacterized protein YecT (DUF1311 family)
MTKILIACLLTCLSVSVFAQQAQHPLDVTLEKCMEKNPSTHGSINCIVEAQQQWDAELNKQYKMLTQKLNAEQKTALLNAQRAWLKWRDAEFKHIEALYSTMQGTMYQPMQLSDRLEIVRKRALDLKGYAALFE